MTTWGRFSIGTRRASTRRRPRTRSRVSFRSATWYRPPWSHLTGGSSAGLKRLDVWTLQDLLYGMVLVSGNDASLAIADHVGRDLLARENKKGDAMKRFVEEMRTTAKAIAARTTENIVLQLYTLVKTDIVLNFTTMTNLYARPYHHILAD